MWFHGLQEERISQTEVDKRKGCWHGRDGKGNGEKGLALHLNRGQHQYGLRACMNCKVKGDNVPMITAITVATAKFIAGKSKDKY